jgi:hypothetical protein
MPMIEESWRGDLQLRELVFSAWLAYVLLALMWERVLRERLAEWKYLLIIVLGAGCYWIDYYFLRAPFYWWLINGYALAFWVCYYFIAVRGRGSLIWTIVAALSAIPFTGVFMMLAESGKLLVTRLGVHEFWLVLASYVGVILVILWRRPVRSIAQA